MKPLELLRLSMAATICGSIFLSSYLWPILAQTIGTLLFMGGLALAGWVVFQLIKAREIEAWRKAFGRSDPAPEEIKAWRSYVRSLAGKQKTTKARLDPRCLFFHNTVVGSKVPYRQTARNGPLDHDDRPQAKYWTV